MIRKSKPTANLQPVGLIGLGLMGRGIASCLLANGLDVVAYNRTAQRAKASVHHIEATLEELVRRRMTPRGLMRTWQKRFRIVRSLADLAPTTFIIETVKEDLELKRRIYDELEAAVAPDTVIASNTSSLPITTLQSGRLHPERFIGMHWGEPAQIMRYLEVIPGDQTSPETLARTLRLGELCGKEPTPLRRDIQGFISNRMMYAMIREACHLVESGIADIETVDRSFRNDIGYWATLAGPFRWMDLTGIPAYAAVMDGLLPKLCNTAEVPKLMSDMVAGGGQGIGNAKGFYPYTKASAKRWEKAWVDFTYDIRKLADRYDAGENLMRSWFFLFCCNLMWALQFTCIKLVQDQVGPMFTVWGPMALSMIMLVPFVLRERPEPSKTSPGRAILIYFLLAGLGVFPAQVMMTWGTRISLASNAALINLTLPVATALFAVIFLREKMTTLRWVSFAVALAGVLLCSGIDFQSLSFGRSYLAGNALIFAGTLGSAFYNSYGKKALEFHSPMRMLFWTYVAVCLMMAPVILIEERDVFARIPHFTAQTWLGMALLTFLHNYLSMILFLKALKNLDAIQASLSNYLITFFGLPIAAIFLHEKLTSSAIVGGVLVLASTLLITVWEELRAARQAEVEKSPGYSVAAKP